MEFIVTSAFPKLSPSLHPPPYLTEFQESASTPIHLSLAWTPLPQLLSAIIQISLRTSRSTTTWKWKQGGLSIKGTGTFKFHIEDDEGGVHLIKIPNSKYVPDLKVCLLLPHHWAQKAKDLYPVPKGTKMDTEDEALTLIWNQQKYRRTIPYHPLTNTPSFCTAPASRTYHAFVALFEAAEAQYH